MVTVRPDTSCRELAVLFREHRVSGLPVTADDGTVVGVVSVSDLLALAAGRHHRGHHAAGQATAGDLMTRPAVTIGPDDLVRTAARLMQSHRVQRLPVVDRDGRLEGIVSRLTVTVHNGIVTLEGEPGSAVLGAGIAGRVEHLEGVVAVRNRFVYPARSAPSFPSDPGL